MTANGKFLLYLVNFNLFFSFLKILPFLLDFYRFREKRLPDTQTHTKRNFLLLLNTTCLGELFCCLIHTPSPHPYMVIVKRGVPPPQKKKHRLGSSVLQENKRKTCQFELNSCDVISSFSSDGLNQHVNLPTTQRNIRATHTKRRARSKIALFNNSRLLRLRTFRQST